MFTWQNAMDVDSADEILQSVRWLCLCLAVVHAYDKMVSGCYDRRVGLDNMEGRFQVSQMLSSSQNFPWFWEPPL
jgi:hypothetical protein